MPPSLTIAVASRWQSKSMQAEVTVPRVTFRDVSYIAMDKTCSGTPAGAVPARLPARDGAQE